MIMLFWNSLRPQQLWLFCLDDVYFKECYRLYPRFVVCEHFSLYPFIYFVIVTFIGVYVRVFLSVFRLPLLLCTYAIVVISILRVLPRVSFVGSF